MEAAIRKNREILKASGAAVILYGAWSIVRVLLMDLIDPVGLFSMFDNYGYTALYGTELSAFSALIAFLICDLLLRLYIGRKAVREANGHRVNYLYIIFSWTYLVISLISDVGYLITDYQLLTLTDAAQILIDLSSCIAFLEIIISTTRLRKITGAGAL